LGKRYLYRIARNPIAERERRIMASITSKDIAAAQVKAKGEEVKLLKDTCDTIADWRITRELNKQGVVPDPEKHKAEAEKDSKILMLMARDNPVLFGDILDNFISDEQY